ncbi:GNAT family N-acetyltransferase [Mucilaginibacter robiniae]|uniref:GNAT family N-acetyltransferase n=1 Tax=Mucilaginibacter robiniae TaxID=2728022 RepID=A0A7L5E596_9SPHI|nr:GNAT family N-acetyltransferase [Mucilaginibacter robiniae]QJD97479.1 GNAT family N-acetyltransferase [Mucilaginibacter robiniae]
MTPVISIKKLTAADAPQLLTISKQTFFDAFFYLNQPEDMELYAAQAFTLKQLLQEITTPSSAFYWAILNNKPVGFIKLNSGMAQNEFQDYNSLEIERLYVLASHQRLQIGSLLMEFAIAEARKNRNQFIWLGVWEHNHQAIRFYQRWGFVTYGSHTFMLGNDQQTDLLMRRDLPDDAV